MRTGARIAILLASLAGLAAVGQVLTGSFSTRCAMDGRRIEWIYTVTVHFSDHTQKAFCSVRCAASFLGTGEKAATVEVRDEISGRILSAERAHFLRSRVGSEPPYDGVHVFADWAQALAQQQALGGELIQNPFKQ